MQEKGTTSHIPLPSETDPQTVENRIEELCERLARSRRRKDKVGMLRELSRLTFYTDPEQSLEYARKAFQTAKSIDDELELARASAQMGQVLHHMRRYDESLPFLENALATYEHHDGTATGRCAMMRIIAAINHSRGDMVATISFLQSALELARQIHNTAEIGESLIWLAFRHIEFGDYARALDMFEEAVQLAKGNSDFQSLVMACTGISSIHQKMENHEAALQILHDTLEITQSINDREGRGVVLSSIADQYRICSQLDAALRYGEEALAIFEDLGWEQNIVTTLYTIGVCFCQLKQWDKGLSFIDRAIAAANRGGFKTSIAWNEMAKGMYLAEVGDYRQALDSLRVAEQIATEMSMRDLLKTIHSIYAELYEQQKEFDLALRHMKLHMEIKKEQDLIEVRQRLSAMELRMNVERAEKEKEIFRMQAEQLHRDMEQKNRELAAMALQQVQTGEIIARLQKMVRSMAPGTGDSGRDMAKVLMEHIGQLGATDSQWKSFEERFTPVHPEFTRKLTTICSDLTPTEMKICTLLRINMSSKEIAAFLGTSVRTVEGHRRFIRRRLNLPPDGSLSMFLATL